uniref:Uncharacterized protein n=1 Tax=Glossina palpalis gambiensis TaxID=67801 RepID=A0A1B0BTE8_9MUSC
MSKTVRSSASVAFRSIPALSSVFTTDSLPHKAASCKAEPEGVNKFTLTPAASKTSTTAGNIRKQSYNYKTDLWRQLQQYQQQLLLIAINLNAFDYNVKHSHTMQTVVK